MAETGVKLSLDQLVDVATTGGLEGYVLTQLADGTFAMQEAAAGGGGGAEKEAEVTFVALATPQSIF